MRDLRRRVSTLAACAVLLGSAGCTITDTYALGDLRARVVDQNNVGIQGVLLDLYKMQGSNAVYWRATATSANGVGVFGERDGGVVPGDYFVRVSFVSQHRLAAGQTNDRPVTVAEGDDITLTFIAEPTTIGPPPP